MQCLAQGVFRLGQFTPVPLQDADVIPGLFGFGAKPQFFLEIGIRFISITLLEKIISKIVQCNAIVRRHAECVTEQRFMVLPESELPPREPRENDDHHQ